MEGLSELLATADELYGLLPEAFTAARDERARRLRQDGSRARALAVKELRRPSVAAWLANALVRHRRPQVEALLQLGEQLRTAQQQLAADQLRELNQQRQALLAALRQEARELARELGRPVSDPVADEVEQTLRAGLADPAAASAIRTGRLTAALSYAGFGSDQVADLVALPPGSSPEQPPQPTRELARAASAFPVPANGGGPAVGRAGGPAAGPGAEAQRPPLDPVLREAGLALAAAQDAADRAQGNALVAEQRRDELARRAERARERLALAHARVAELESLLSAAREAAAAAAAGWAPLHAEADAARARAEAARGLADSTLATVRAARAHLDRVEAQTPSDD